MASSSSPTARPASAAAEARAYFKTLPPDARKVVKAIRDIIRATAPDAVEHFSYGIPGFRFANRPLIWYAGWKEHTSIYPFSDVFARAHGIDLTGYKTSKGTIRFPLSAPLPSATIERLIKARLAELRAKPKK